MTRKGPTSNTTTESASAMEDPRTSTQRRPKGSSWRVRLASSTSFIFDVFTALLSVVDVVSDALVAYQFYATPGQMVWFYMVVASIFVSNCIYAGMMLIQLGEARYGIECSPRVMLRVIVLYMLCFPFAQAFPLLQWLSELFPSQHMRLQRPDVHAKKTDRRDDDDDTVGMPREDSWTVKVDGTKDGGGDMSTVVREELAGDEDAKQLLRMFHKGLAKHLRSHLGFYIETVVEAVPQSVIQLLAVTALGEATDVQLLSMCLSLFTIVSKAYLMSVSLDLKSMLWKASLVAFDVFTAFFVFSTLVASNHSADQKEATYTVVPFLWSMTVSTTWLGSAWIQMYLWSVSIAVVSAIGCGVFLVFDVWIVQGQRPWEYLWVGFLLPAIFAVAFVPCSIVFEGVKLSWILLPVNNSRIVSTEIPFFALAWQFVGRGFRRSHEEGMRRLKHFIQYATPLLTATSARWAAAYDPYWRRCAEINLRLDRIYISNCRMPSYWDQAANTDWQTHPTWRLTVIDDCLRFVDPRHTPKVDERRRNVFVVAWGSTVLLMISVSVLFNLAFPFVHVALYGWSQLNILQAACLVCACVSLCVVVGLGHHAYSFLTFLFASDQLLLWQWNRPNTPTSKHIAAMVASYCRPPHARALQTAVKVSVLPFEVVVDVVASYMAPSDIDLSNLTAAQCAALKEANY